MSLWKYIPLNSETQSAYVRARNKTLTLKVAERFPCLKAVVEYADSLKASAEQ